MMEFFSPVDLEKAIPKTGALRMAAQMQVSRGEKR
jgi:hypothetical protein